MMRHIILAGAAIFLASMNAHASIMNATLNCFTSVEPDATKTVSCVVNLKDEHGDVVWPEKISTMEVVLPDGITTIDFNPPYQYFENHQKSYFKRMALTDLYPGATVAPSGQYTLTVTDTSANTLTSIDVLNGRYMTQPRLVQPTDGQIVTNPEQRIAFTRPGGADHYRIMLKEYNGFPVLWTGDYPAYLHTKDNDFRLPLGVLKNNRAYLMFIEARDTDQDIDRRSRSSVVYFETQF